MQHAASACAEHTEVETPSAGGINASTVRRYVDVQSTPSETHHWSGPSRIAVVVPMLVVVLVAIALTLPTTAPAHQLWATAVSKVAQTQANSQTTAVEDVIQQANQEQVAALASNTPSQ